MTRRTCGCSDGLEGYASSDTIKGRKIAIVVRDESHLGPGCEEPSNDLGVPSGGRGIQGRLSARILHIGCSATIDQERHRRCMSITSSSMKTRLTIIVYRINMSAAIKQQRDRQRMSVVRSTDETRHAVYILRFDRSATIQ